MTIVDDRCKYNTLYTCQRATHFIKVLSLFNNNGPIYIGKSECFPPINNNILFGIIVLDGFPVDLGCNAEAVVGRNEIKSTYVVFTPSTRVR